MSLSNDFETGLLDLILKNTDLALVGDATGLRGSSTVGSLYLALHTANPGEAGKQNTSEATYTSYARVAIARNATQWTVVGNNGTNANLITFPAATGGSETLTHFSLGTDASGAGKVFVYGALNVSLPVVSGVQPKIPAGDLDINAD